MHESCVLESVGLRLSIVSGYQQILRSHAMLRVLFCLVSSRRMNCQSMYNVRGVRFVLVAMHEVPYPFQHSVRSGRRVCGFVVYNVLRLSVDVHVQLNVYYYVDELQTSVHTRLQTCCLNILRMNSLSARVSCNTINCTVPVVSRGSIRNSQYHSGFVILVCFRLEHP